MEDTTIRTFDHVQYAGVKWTVGWCESGKAMIFNLSSTKFVDIVSLKKLRDGDDARRSFNDPYPEE